MFILEGIIDEFRAMWESLSFTEGFSEAEVYGSQGPRDRYYGKMPDLFIV